MTGLGYNVISRGLPRSFHSLAMTGLDYIVISRGLPCSFHSLAMTGLGYNVIARALVPVAISAERIARVANSVRL